MFQKSLFLTLNEVEISNLRSEKHVDLNYDDKIEERKSKRIISFVDPENKARLIKMTATDINQIFNKRKFRRNKNGRLTKSDRKKALECRKKDKLLWKRDKKCYHPLAQEPCRAANKWFVAHKTRLDGVCRIKPCLGLSDDGDNEFISVNGTCTPADDETICFDDKSQLELNIYGQGYYKCNQGFSKQGTKL